MALAYLLLPVPRLRANVVRAYQTVMVRLPGLWPSRPHLGVTASARVPRRTVLRCRHHQRFFEQCCCARGLHISYIYPATAALHTLRSILCSYAPQRLPASSTAARPPAAMHWPSLQYGFRVSMSVVALPGFCAVRSALCLS